MVDRCLQSELGRVVVAGSGFLADAYDLYVISMVQTVMDEVFALPKDQRTEMETNIKNAALIGAIVGQLTFGYLADRIGRKVIFFVTGTLIVFGSLLSAAAPPSLSPKGVYWWVAGCRLLLGFGIGGEYPLSATITAESCAARRRGTLMACVFSMQGVGYLLSTLVMLAAVSAGASKDSTWRFGLAFGAVVPAISLYFRLRLHESDSYERVAQQRQQGDQNVEQLATFAKYKWHVLGTAMNWFLFDICFYGNGLFNQDVTSKVLVLHGSDQVLEKMKQTLIIVLMQLPGYLIAVMLINKLGRKNMQLTGYVGMLGFFVICAFGYNWFLEHSKSLFLFCFGMTFFFSNFGPNTTTFIIPGEIFPAQVKATCHGISAASGKLGAALGTTLFGVLKDRPDFIQVAMLLCSGCCVLGLVVTVLLTPRYRPEQLDPKQPGETVGFLPLRFQRDAGRTPLVSGRPGSVEAESFASRISQREGSTV